MIKKILFSCFLLLFACTGYANSQVQATLCNEQGIEKLEANDPFGAIKDFITACRLSPFDDKYSKNLAYARFMAGRALFEMESHEKAENHLQLALKQEPFNLEFRLMLFDLYVKLKKRDLVLAQGDKIITLRPEDPALTRYLAINTYKTQQSVKAIKYLENYIENYGNNLHINKLLGGLLYEKGRLTDALEVLRPVENQNLRDLDALNLISKINSELAVKEGLDSSSSDNFILWLPKDFEFELFEILLSNLEKIYDGLGDALCFYPLEPVEIIIVEDAEYKSLYSYKEGTAGMYDGKIVIPVAKINEPDKLARTLRHEYVHHLIYWISEDSAPLWLNEGLAQLLETDDFEGMLEENLQNLALSFRELDRLYIQSMETKNFRDTYKWSLVKTLKIVTEIGLEGIVQMLRTKNYQVGA